MLIISYQYNQNILITRNTKMTHLFDENSSKAYFSTDFAHVPFHYRFDLV